jgi:hypothetical protein
VTQALEQKSLFALILDPLESQSFMNQGLEQNSFFALQVDVFLLYLALLLQYRVMTESNITLISKVING